MNSGSPSCSGRRAGATASPTTTGCLRSRMSEAESIGMGLGVKSGLACAFILPTRIIPLFRPETASRSLLISQSMQAQFHSLLKVWFHFVEANGYMGIFLLMAVESSVVPLPSEVVIPPAAYWAAQGRKNFWLVVVVGALGGLFGSLISYFVCLWVGAP